MTTSPTHDPDTPTDADATFVVGGGAAGRDVADRLAARGDAVTHVDRTALPDPPPGHVTHTVDSFDVHSLRAAGLAEAGTVVVLTGDDACNLMVAQHARSAFDADRVVVAVNDPDRRPLFDALDVETVDAAAAVGRTVTELW
ncbi:NAD-binding protein [Halobacterium yunchengense]|uniref:NAD-binding protein n=1 Tax=Halobacterium yunchengense TaxID=3108497 RepID=UPI00300B72FC